MNDRDVWFIWGVGGVLVEFLIFIGILLLWVVDCLGGDLIGVDLYGVVFDLGGEFF